MATVPVPRTWVVGEIVTAAEMNGLRDALNFLLAPPGALAYNTAGASITTGGTPQTIPLDAEVYDTDAMHSLVTNNSRLTVITPGVFTVKWLIEWNADGTGQRQGQAMQNGSFVNRQSLNAVTGSIVSTNCASFDIRLAVADYLELQGFQNRGSSLSTVGGPTKTWLSAAWQTS